MAKKSSIQKNNRRKKLTEKFAKKRSILKAIIYNKNTSLEERFKRILELAQIPRNSARTRVRNRCELTGRPRGVINKFGLSRHKIRELSGEGLIPGLIKASW